MTFFYIRQAIIVWSRKSRVLRGVCSRNRVYILLEVIKLNLDIFSLIY